MRKPKELIWKDGKLIFKDYALRNVSILEEKYLELMSNREKQAVRTGLEDCLYQPDEVWIDKVETEEGKISLYRYFKFYKDGTYLVLARVNSTSNFQLIDFSFFEEEQISEVEQLRKGIPAKGGGIPR